MSLRTYEKPLPWRRFPSILRWTVPSFTCAILIACSLDFSTGPVVVPDPDAGGGQPEDARALQDAREERDSNVPIDAQVDADASPGCAPGTVIAPKSAYNPLAGRNNSPPCRVNEIYSNDGKSVGLDGLDNEQPMPGGVDVTSCIGVVFESPMSNVIIRMRASAVACSSACTGSYCGSGRSAEIFLGSTIVDIRHIEQRAIGTSFEDFSVAPAAIAGTDRVVVVCRTDAHPDRDDVEVDSIAATCR